MTDATFLSKFRHIGPVRLPWYSDTRVMMMPLVLGDVESVPPFLTHWAETLIQLADMTPEYRGQVGYITIDEQTVQAGTTHRRSGLHVDGVYRGGAGGWGGGGGGAWGGNGMITVSNPAGCRAWGKAIVGTPGDEGECDHLAGQCPPEQATLLEAGEAYWLSGLCVHESVPMTQTTQRQFVRLSMPSTAPWFEGYTENPLGVRPTGPVLPQREFMRV